MPNAFGPSSTSRTITVNSGGTLNFAASDMFGAYTTYLRFRPSMSKVEPSPNSNGAHQEFNSLILNGGT